MSEFTTIARPYAKAIFDFSVEQKSVDLWQKMLTFATKVIKNKQIKELFPYAIMSPNVLSDLFIAICGENLNQNGRNLIQIMAENGRLNILPDVLEQFIYLRLEKESTSVIEIISSDSLSKEQILRISSVMEKRLMKKVKLIIKTDKSIIAGIIIRLGNTVIDGSVRNRLEKLAEKLR